MAHPVGVMRAPAVGGEDRVMSQTSTTEQLRVVRAQTGTLAMLARMVAAEAMRTSLERIRFREQQRRRHAAERRRKALGLAAVAALALAGAALAARRASRPSDEWDDAPPAEPVDAAEPPVASPAGP
jgi:murein DD-endopeptidase MepM/ murein hydrolase activator NlpD